MHKFQSGDSGIDVLYLDSNSIVYDSLREMDVVSADVDASVIEAVVAKLDEYIATVRPSRMTVVAFDGVAPAAKTSQQRERRYRSSLERVALGNAEGAWDTCKITPGTEFMNRLMTRLNTHYADNDRIVVRGSDEAGEGEHKIFEDMRALNLADSNVVVYGLDADLIMLGLLHYKLCKSLYLYRETPHFIRSINPSLHPGETYLLDVGGLATKLHRALGGTPACVRDYVLMCFVLGNDFLPHFPSLSLRDAGHDVIIDAYGSALSKEPPGTALSVGQDINWRLFKKIIERLSQREETAMVQKCGKRQRQENGRSRKREKQSFEEARLADVPLRCQGLEHYLSPGSDGWRGRYYRAFQGVDRHSPRMRGLMMEYLRGVEWTWCYYVHGCKDWRWHYPVAYPPLLCDLVSCIPDFPIELLPPSAALPFEPEEQLLLVVPSRSASVVPERIREEVAEKTDASEHKWAFCRYFWEGNIEFKDDALLQTEILA